MLNLKPKLQTLKFFLIHLSCPPHHLNRSPPPLTMQQQHDVVTQRTTPLRSGNNATTTITPPQPPPLFGPPLGTNDVQVVCALVIFILYNFYLSHQHLPPPPHCDVDEPSQQLTVYFCKLHVRHTIDVTEEVNNVTYLVHYYF